MKLREAETFSTLDHHDGCVRHVHANLYNRSSHQDLRLAGDKLLHLGILIRRFHTAMYHTYLIFREKLLERLKTGLQVFIIQFLISFNQRIYHINLTPLLYLFPKELIQLRLFIIIAMKRLYRFTSRR